MRSTRSGAPPRILLYQAPEYWVVRTEFFVFNFLFGFLPFLIAAASFVSCGRVALLHIVDPHDAIHRLDKPLNEEEKRSGAVRLGGTITEGEVCLLIHEHMSKDWEEDSRATFIGGDGVSINVDHELGRPVRAGRGPLRLTWNAATWDQLGKSWRWEPSIVAKVLHPDSAREKLLRERIDQTPSGGRLREGCLHTGDRIFVDAAKTPATPEQPAEAAFVLRTGGEEAIVLTPGDGSPQPRIDERAALLSGEVSLLGAAVLLALVYGSRLTRARPFVAGLLRRLRLSPFVTAGTQALCVIGLAPIALLLTLCLLPLSPSGAQGVMLHNYGYAVTYATIVGSLILGLRIRDRRSVMATLSAAMNKALTPSLAGAPVGKNVALEAKVSPDAPLAPGLLTGKARAHSSIGVTRVYRSGRNYASSQEPERKGSVLLSIQASSGEAKVDFTHAVVDIPAVRKVVRKRAIRRGDFKHILGELPPSNDRYLLEERFLAPGEALYIEGRVQRFEAGGGASGRIPVIGGTSEEPLIVHAGSRRSLLLGITIERRFLDVALSLTAAVAAATLAITAYLVHL